MDRQLLNIVLLGVAFFLIFTSFQTGSIIQKVVTDSINQDYANVKWDGYLSLSIIYAVFSISNFIAPLTLAFLGPKYSMIAGALTYCLFIATFLYPLPYGLYVSSVIIGIGAAIIWTGQGNFLTINSNTDTIARNSGIFWALLQCSLLFGNLFVYFEFAGESRIEKNTRMVVYSTLTAVGVLGTLILLVLRTGPPKELDESAEAPPNSTPNVKEVFLKSFRLLRTKRMCLLCITFFYTGLELSFFSGVYGTAIGFSKALGEDAQKLLGISGMLIGVGEIAGGALFGLLGPKTAKQGRDPIILLGYVVHMLAFFLIYINLPREASVHTTYDNGFITSSIGLALFCSLLLGFGDSCFNTQIYSILGSIYSDDSAPAFAMFKFIQSIATAIAFYYSKAVYLDKHIYILAMFATVATLSFCVIEWSIVKWDLEQKSKAKDQQERHSNSSSQADTNSTELSSTDTLSYKV